MKPRPMKIVGFRRVHASPSKLSIKSTYFFFLGTCVDGGSRGLGSTRSRVRAWIRRVRCGHVTCNRKRVGTYSHMEQETTNVTYKYRGGLTLLRYRPNTITRAHKPVGPSPAKPPPPPSCHVAPHTGIRVDPRGPRGLPPRVRALCASCASRGPPAALPRGLRAASHQRGGPARHVSSLIGPARHISTCR